MKDNTIVDSPKELTDWANPPKVSDLRADFLAAEADMTAHITKVSEWLDLLNITGSAKILTPEGKSEVQPKLIRKQNEWRYPALSEPFLSSTDLFSVNPVTYEDKASAVQNALVLNNQINTKIDKVKFIDEYIRTGVDEGTVVVKVGWVFEEEEQQQPKYKYVISNDPQEMERITSLAQLAQQDPNKFKLEVPKELQEAVQLSISQNALVVPVLDGLETVMVTTKNHPVWEVCEYDNVSIDPTAKGDSSKAQFIIHSFESSLSDLKRDGRYSNLDALGNTDPMADIQYNEKEPQSFRFKDKPRQKLVVHEYWGFWDIDDSGITTAIVASYVNDVMVRLIKNPFGEELPFVLVQMLPVRKSNYGETDAELIGDNQKIIGAVKRGMVDVLARSANSQVGYAKGLLDITNRRKLQAGEDYEFNPTMSPDQAFYMHKYPELPQSASIMIQMEVSDAESVTGVRPFAQSQTGSIGGDTAAGVKSANDATSKRDTAILRRFSEGIVALGRKTLSMNQQFLSEEEVVRVTNEEFVTVRKDDLAGEFDLAITISTAEEDQAKAQELSFMMQTMGNNMDANMSKMILSEIATLRKMPVLAKQIKDFQPQPDPVQQQIQQLEIQKLQAEIAKFQSEAAENNAEAQLDMAKARDLSSSADIKDLDFVETESGIKHNRDLDKMAQQSKAQAQTKMVEAQLRNQDKQRDHEMDKEKEVFKHRLDKLNK